LSAIFLIILLVLLILFSCFFSGSETAMMALNRYKLRHMMKKNHKGALHAGKLLERPDQLLGTILIGNTFANLLASAIATVLALQFFGEWAVLIVAMLLALIVLIFAEIMPKTLAVLYSEQLSLLVSWPLSFLLKLFYPLVWVATAIANGVLRIFGIKVEKGKLDELTGEEVRTLVHESTSQLALGSKKMMLGVLDLGGVTVNDIKVPKTDLVGIDIEAPWEETLKQLATAQHTRLPIYRENIENVSGIIHLRSALNLAAKNQLDKKALLKMAEEVYFIPDSTPLNVQLVNFRRQRKRIGLVVDEYGDIEGLVTIDDILEEIVGEFTTDMADAVKNVTPKKDGSFIVDGGITVRELNRRMHWEFSLSGPVTLSGMIIEYLETIPEKNICLTIDGYHMEVIQLEENMVKKVKVWPGVK
jgi:Mg2+/Co2+ transporter CorB